MPCSLVGGGGTLLWGGVFCHGMGGPPPRKCELVPARINPPEHTIVDRHPPAVKPSTAGSTSAAIGRRRRGAGPFADCTNPATNDPQSGGGGAVAQ